MNSLLSKFTKKNFANVYSGVKGDVNWRNGKFIDARPNIEKYNASRIRPRNPIKLHNNTDYADLLKEARDHKYVNHSRKRFDILMDYVKLRDKKQ